jgi:hypothetical protein
MKKDADQIANHVTTDPAAAKRARRRVIEQDAAMRDRDAPGLHARRAPGDDRREEAQRKTGLGLGFVRRTD